MKQSSNLGLALYEQTDLMNITGSENSLNHNMELIDTEITQLKQDMSAHNISDTAHPDIRNFIRHATGSPLTAATAAGMTDTDKVYVYTGAESGYANGHWYYYDSAQAAWRDGGVYNSQALETDASLLVAGAAADSAAVGEKFGILEQDVDRIKSAVVTPDKTSFIKYETEVAEDVTYPNFTNQLPISTVNGAVVGLVPDTYISSSSGNTSAKAGYSTSGFIPITGSTASDIVRFQSAGFSSTNSYCRIGIYDENKRFLITINGTGILKDSAFKGRYTLDDAGNYVSLDFSAKNNYFIVNRGSTPKYIRICSPGFGDASVVTVNEEITYTTIPGEITIKNFSLDQTVLVPQAEKNKADINLINQEVESIDQRVQAFEQGNTPEPEYVMAEAKSVAKKLQAARKAGSFVLAAFSDFHVWDDDAKTEAGYKNTRESVTQAGQALRALRSQIGLDFVSLLGDYTWGGKPYTAEQIMTDITSIKENFSNGLQAVPSAWLTGNHDINYPANRDRMMTADEQYAYIAANAPELVRDADNLAGNYGLIDFPNQRIRVICLNTTDVMEEFPEVESESHVSENIGEKQARWFAEKALDFTGKDNVSDWGIVILSHHPISMFVNRGYILRLLEAYKNSESGSVTANFTPHTGYPVVNYTIRYDYSSGAKAQILCNIHGHLHNCAYGYMSSSDGVAPWMLRLCVPQICYTRNNEVATSTDTAYAQKYGEFDSTGNPVYHKKSAGTAKGTSFCVVDINKEDQLVHAYIYGAGVDRHLSVTNQ